MRGLIAASIAVVGTVFAAPAWAQAKYPDKPIKLIVPFPAGGGGDVLARTVTNKIAEVLGQQFVVENRAGAGGNIGSAATVKADPDGYTVLYGTNGTLAINHALYKSTGFEPLKDFDPVARLTEIALIVVVHPSLAVASVKDLIAHAKANPGKLNVATAGNGTTSHLAADMFKTAASIDWRNVHYRGGAPAMTDLVGGQVQVMIEIMANAIPQVNAKTLKALAVSTAQRWPQTPELPTISESGLPGFAVTAWDALMVPKGTPAAAIATLNAAANKALADPELQKNLLGRGAKTVGGSPDVLRKFIEAEFPRWGDVVRASGAKID